MNEVLLIDPSIELLSNFEDDSSIAFYSGKSVFHWEEKATQRNSRRINYPKEIGKDAKIGQIRRKLEWSMPIWYRWMGKSEDYDLYSRTCLLFILDLAQYLQELKVRYVIFSTGVAHHVEYSLIEAACQAANIPQIFLYAMPFGREARLLPLIQEEGISDRKLLALSLSKNNSEDSVKEYLKNFLGGYVPTANEKIDWQATSLIHAIFQVLYIELKSIVKKIIRWDKGVVKDAIDQRLDYDWSSLIGLVNRQKQALSYYLTKTVDCSRVDAVIAKEGRVPTIFAHYQPEATTFPEGGNIANHIDIVLEIRKKGYSGTIFYKEHPGSWIYYSKITGVSRVGLCRSIEYYKQLESLGCVFLETSFKLQSNYIHSLFPVTITGSIAIERSLAGFATCCAGQPWFKNAPGVYGFDETFGANGIFADVNRWYDVDKRGEEWFVSNLTYTTLTNIYGIGTGLPSSSADKIADYLDEFENLVKGLSDERG